MSPSPLSAQPNAEVWERVTQITSEMRAPLSGLVGYLQGLEDGVFPANPVTFDRLSQQMARLQGLLEELATLTHTASPSR